MSSIRRKALLVSAAVLSGALLMTACEDGDTGAAQDSSSTAPSGQSDGKGSGAKDEGAKDTDGTGGTGEGAGSGADTGDGGRAPVEQVCGANDISWSTRSETQAGGYILVMAKAKSGITCYLPAGLPVVAFGSDGTEAGPAEQSVGDQIKLSGNTTAYAGVNPKTTNNDYGKELEHIIVAVGQDDPNPVSLKVGTITVDKPIVTNWHTVPADAVPFS
ncbi:DUF4232 domain-containing protein [Streptomyces tagetis]|uniref:DUF4232 domain-containing protein n=1 Tax=Streptomyces tagetis TaxID=2820809 RepID=A0A940XGY0_9ACTN|nr:DUF4232 domain-containing protein [Streptomyces sp. RG38]MBQ0828214.1 DUF4232 domain-containing protein [Streptomyces sp. RG38]